MRFVHLEISQTLFDVQPSSYSKFLAKEECLDLNFVIKHQSSAHFYTQNSMSKNKKSPEEYTSGL